MVAPIDSRIDRARELLQAAREEFARAEEARGGAAVIGLRNACGKGWLAALEAVKAFLLAEGVPESQLPDNDRSRRYYVGAHMDRNMRRAYTDIRQTFHIDGYYEGIVEFDEMPERLDELEGFIDEITALGSL